MAHFPFFRLPRELRDRIYADVGGDNISINLRVACGEYQKDDGTTWCNAIGLETEVFSLPTSDCLVVSRAFKEEYEKEVLRHMMVRVLGKHNESLSFGYLNKESKIHRRMRQVTKLEIKLWGHSLDFGLYDTMKSCMCPYMPGLKIITQYFLFDSDGVDLAPGTGATQRLLGMLKDSKAQVILPDKTRSDVMQLKTRVFFESQLISMAKSIVPTVTELEEYPIIFGMGWADFAKLVESMPENRVIFEATTSDVEQEGASVELKVFEAADFSCERAMRAIEAHLRDQFAELL